MLGADPTSLEDLIERPEWMRDAACREHPEINWFPGRGESLNEAREVCRACLVRDECLDYALTLDDSPGGMWGATSERERRSMRNRKVVVGPRPCSGCSRILESGHWCPSCASRRWRERKAAA